MCSSPWRRGARAVLTPEKNGATSGGGVIHAPGRHSPGKGGKPRAKDVGGSSTEAGVLDASAPAAGKRKSRGDDLEGWEGARRKVAGKGKERAKGKGKGRLMIRDYSG